MSIVLLRSFPIAAAIPLYNRKARRLQADFSGWASNVKATAAPPGPNNSVRTIKQGLTTSTRKLSRDTPEDIEKAGA